MFLIMLTIFFSSGKKKNNPKQSKNPEPKPPYNQRKKNPPHPPLQKTLKHKPRTESFNLNTSSKHRLSCNWYH